MKISFHFNLKFKAFLFFDNAAVSVLHTPEDSPPCMGYGFPLSPYKVEGDCMQ